MIDLLEAVLSDVAEPEVAGQAIERESPGVAQAERVDLGEPRDDSGERVVVGDRVALVLFSPVDVDAQDLSEQRAATLRVAIGIADPATVAGRDVEIPVAPELQLPAVVRRARVRDAQDQPRDAIDRRGAACGVQLPDLVGAIDGRVVDEEAPVLSEVRVERDRVEPLLAV